MSKRKSVEAGLYTPIIFRKKTIQQVLETYFSKSEIVRLKKQDGIKIAQQVTDTWIKVGQRLFIIQDIKYPEITHQAHLHWHYYFMMKDERKKLLDWKSMV